MLLKDLLEKQEIKCPKWLNYEIIKDEWNNSTYKLGKEHTWTLEDCMISYDGTEYRFSWRNPETGEFQPVREINEYSVKAY